MNAAQRQKARRERELALGRRGRLIYLSDREYEQIKRLITFIREHKDVDVVATKTGDQR